ncbi:MAG: hypothetical protein LBU32_28735 [Clostridiales bacterium]|jgi:hypothetical protein|nr:hypothetical protein [Clostridiales bacterium]
MNGRISISRNSRQGARTSSWTVPSLHSPARLAVALADGALTRDKLARSAFIMGEFENQEENEEILSLNLCSNSQIVQIICDNNAFTAKEGIFNPEETVTNAEIFFVMKK